MDMPRDVFRKCLNIFERLVTMYCEEVAPANVLLNEYMMMMMMMMMNIFIERLRILSSV